MKHTAHGWWLEEAGETTPLPPLEEAVVADVVVVGGGYTGLWTAWHALEREPGARVVLLEGEVCGHGPSGRNGGFCESLWFQVGPLRARLGDAAARQVAEESSGSVDAIGQWCEREGVDAWFDQSGYVMVATADAHREVVTEAVDNAAAVGAADRVRPLDEAQVRSRCDIPGASGGLLIPDYATVQPARLALGLRARLIERGARIFERSRARRLRPVGPHAVEVATDGGSVRAGAAVLALGAAARGFRPLRSRLAVTSSHAIVTEPVPDVLDALGWTGGECITDGLTFVHYFRTTRDRRIVFGWGGGAPAYGGRLSGRVEVDRRAAARVRDDLLTTFPGLGGRRIAHVWGGPIDVSPDHVLQVGSLPEGPIYYATGFTGNGVGPSHLAGSTLASLALDRRDAPSRLPLVDVRPPSWVPPEPLAYAGGSFVRSAMLRRDRLEARGSRPGPVTRATCAAPRLVGMHLGR
jgi:glycine/D-amino acid oxidase-like deaminating enzyme